MAVKATEPVCTLQNPFHKTLGGKYFHANGILPAPDKRLGVLENDFQALKEWCARAGQIDPYFSR